MKKIISDLPKEIDKAIASEAVVVVEGIKDRSSLLELGFKSNSIYILNNGISLNENIEPTPLLREELRNYVVDNIGSIAKPDELKFINEMPKLDNGKTDRGKLRELALEGTPKLKGVEEEHIKILEELREEYQKLYLS